MDIYTNIRLNTGYSVLLKHWTHYYISPKNRPGYHISRQVTGYPVSSLCSSSDTKSVVNKEETVNRVRQM